MKKFSFCENGFVQCVSCTKEAFDALLSDTTVIDNCAKIRHIVENMPADASEVERKHYKKLISELKSGCQEKGIKPLPAWCFHATFRDNRRRAENAIPSGLCSIDLDHIDDPRDFWTRLKDTALAENVCLAFVTPSTQGLKMVFPLPEEAHNMEEAQDILVRKLGVEAYFDHGTMDLTRLAFVVPADYILYRNDEELFKDRTVREDFGKLQETTTDDAMVVEHVAEQKASEHFVDGIPMQQMIEYLSQKYCGLPEPDQSHRNDTLFKVAKVMRVACSDDFGLLCSVMPLWGQTTKEWNATLRSACHREIAQTARQEFEEMMSALKREKAIREGDNSWSLPEPPKDLPPVFREYASVTPMEIRAAQLLTLLPVLGFYGTMSKANFADPDEEEDWCTPSFIVVVSAPTGQGKKAITKTYNRLTEEQRIKEQPLTEQLNRYNLDKKNGCPPIEPIRLMPEKLSMTSLSVQLERAHGQHLLLFTPEIDTLKSSNGSGAYNDLSTVIRKAIDNDCIGQIYMSGESHSCNVPVYLNMLIEAQPETLKEFFNKKNVINGMVSRVNFVELEDNTGCRKVKVRKMTDFEWSNVKRTVDYLQTIGVVKEPAQFDANGNLVKCAVLDRQELKLTRSRNALKQWGIRHQDHYLQSQENPAEDHFFRRAALLGFHAAMVAYMCSGCHETNKVVDFALWVAEYTLQCQLLHFGNTYNSIHTKREDNRTDEIINLSKVSRFNLLENLPQEFGVEDMKRVLTENRHHMKNPYSTVSRWKAAGLVVEVPTETVIKRWRKAS